ncbi:MULTISPECIES: hypothetical protein [Streptomyces]|uniref:Lipoprotein n=1 Tax=Streptomyces lasiicapitis TaxID=1923961 RepID=A0ABQ2MKQ1_9ACTN|nr:MULTISPECIES: hypothetical protein [Streptomyces]QIB44073.1 hypothetical protein G3H79_14275 [Streptomyces aureoverticillatus]GGO53479.1 hypothetical protein GCM10012286_61020 [Streptomyces lasiicapitis]
MNRPARGRPARARLVVVAAALFLLTGCAQSVDPIERLGRKAAEKMPSRKAGPSPGCERAGAAAPGAGPGARTESAAPEEPDARAEPGARARRCPDAESASPVPAPRADPP